MRALRFSSEPDRRTRIIQRAQGSQGNVPADQIVDLRNEMVAAMGLKELAIDRTRIEQPLKGRKSTASDRGQFVVASEDGTLRLSRRNSTSFEAVADLANPAAEYTPSRGDRRRRLGGRRRRKRTGAMGSGLEQQHAGKSIEHDTRRRRRPAPSRPDGREPPGRPHRDLWQRHPMEHSLGHSPSSAGTRVGNHSGIQCRRGSAVVGTGAPDGLRSNGPAARRGQRRELVGRDLVDRRREPGGFGRAPARSARRGLEPRREPAGHCDRRRRGQTVGGSAESHDLGSTTPVG